MGILGILKGRWGGGGVVWVRFSVLGGFRVLGFRVEGLGPVECSF